MTKSIHVGGRPVWAEISLKAILKNLQVIRRHIGPKPKILAVVKSNAYGLGAVPISKALQKAGVEWFGVTCANEGIELRESGIRKRILVLTGFWPGEEKRLIQNNLTPTVTRLEDVRHLERAAKSVARKIRPRALSSENQYRHEPPRHLAVRNRCLCRACWPIAATFELEGTFTHFASAEDFSARQTDDQERFSGVPRRACATSAFRRESCTWPIAARSAPAPAPGRTWFAPARFSTAITSPSIRRKKATKCSDRLPIEPSLSLRARIITLRDLPRRPGCGLLRPLRHRTAVAHRGDQRGLCRRHLPPAHQSRLRTGARHAASRSSAPSLWI